MSRALVIGAGPAGLMAAEELANAGLQVTVCEAKPSIGRKLLMAGKSGLNLAMDKSSDVALPNYLEAAEALAPMLRAFDADAVQAWARGLGQEVFTGSTGRVFPTAMKASPLLRAWAQRLTGAGVVIRTNMRWQGWQDDMAAFHGPDGAEAIPADVTVLALGGASWARLGSDGAWVGLLEPRDIDITPFASANAGLCVAWSDHMTPHFGCALKAVRWQAGDVSSRGEAVISARGLEGGGIYALTPALREGAVLTVDLAPDRPAADLQAQLSAKPRKTRLSQWLKNTLRLPPAKTSLFFEMTQGATLQQDAWVKTLKALPIRYAGMLPMDEAISTAGGVSFGSLTPGLMLKARPGVFCAGEMLDWEAPTGGYLITACLATGRWAGKEAARYVADAA
ncbi:TIGR03862 family flavoprotein [Roseobacter sp. YSTF-M11]|uniref:TIGR03862 family flavoprotein n=1 Tax=Roseobacter insulae TaxID=2859783 RepID=A0A9X1FSZ8_9RHOB|nr:TIGR03862 family flavoprotein [Roseobacter insulae]MBW4706570.1 TIGR03862 family flavoprotein [Roseobacter insulae]